MGRALAYKTRDRMLEETRDRLERKSSRPAKRQKRSAPARKDSPVQSPQDPYDDYNKPGLWASGYAFNDGLPDTPPMMGDTSDEDVRQPLGEDPQPQPQEKRSPPIRVTGGDADGIGCYVPDDNGSCGHLGGGSEQFRLRWQRS